MDILGLARHGLNNFEQIAVVGVVVVAFISLIYDWMLRGNVLKKDKGTPKMQEVWKAISMLSISETGHFLDRTLWHNQAALASSLRPRL